MRETLLLDVPHRQIVFTIPKRLRVFFKFDRRLLGDLCRSALRSLSRSLGKSKFFHAHFANDPPPK